MDRVGHTEVIPNVRQIKTTLSVPVPVAGVDRQWMKRVMSA